MTEFQFGFTKNKSTVDAIVAFLDKISLHSDNRHIISVFCDLTKAFDCVNHQILLRKLENLGIRGLPLKWFRSYLSNRSQFTSTLHPSSTSSTLISLTETRSTLAPIECGVPQGSILGPILFNLYINDLPLIDNKNSNYILYADDTSIIFSTNDPNSVYDKLESVLSTTTEWFKRNHLILNLSKTTYMHIRPTPDFLTNYPPNRSIKIDSTEQTKFLGVTFSSDLSWQSHINTVTKKIKPGIAMLFKLRHSLPTPALLQIYFSLIHSHLSYAILIWGGSPETSMIKLLRLQKKAIRIIDHKPPRTSCRPLFKKYNILTITSLYILQSALHIKKALTTNQTNPSGSSIQTNRDIHSHYTRQRNNIFIHNLPNSARKTNVNYSSSIIYNKLPDHLKQITCVRKFKRATKEFLLTNSFYSVQELCN